MKSGSSHGDPLLEAKNVQLVFRQSFLLPLKKRDTQI